MAVTTHADIKTELHRERKRLLVFTHFLALAIYGLFIPYDFLVESRPTAALMEMGLFLLLVFNLLFLIRRELLTASALIILILVGAEILVSIVAVIDQAIVVKELYWAVVITPASFYLNGRRLGIMISSVMFILTWGIYLFYSAEGATALNRQLMIDYSGVYIVIAIISFLYARSQSLNIKRMLHYHRDLAFANDELKVAALTDTLTCSYNRKFLDELLYELTGDKRHSPFALIMMDVDHFKQINDNHGHQVGDEVLSIVTHELQKQLRENDILGRWGGEEFIIISQGHGATAGLNLAERLRRFIENYSFPHGLIITCSFGVVESRANESKNELIKRADSALYSAKRTGRNRSILFE